MSEEAEHKRRHRHHRHHHHHHHHGHSGVTPFDPADEFPLEHPFIERPYGVTNDNMVTHQDQRQYHSHAAAPADGGFNEVLSRILQAVNSLPSRSVRQRALGYAIARLIEQERIGGLKDVTSVVLVETNRYAHISDDIHRTAAGWLPPR